MRYRKPEWYSPRWSYRRLVETGRVLRFAYLVRPFQLIIIQRHVRQCLLALVGRLLYMCRHGTRILEYLSLSFSWHTLLKVTSDTWGIYDLMEISVRTAVIFRIGEVKRIRHFDTALNTQSRLHSSRSSLASADLLKSKA